MAYVILRYTGDQPGGLLHYGAGPSMEHPDWPAKYDWTGGQLVRLDDTDPRYQFYLDMHKNNLGMFEIVESG